MSGAFAGVGPRITEVTVGSYPSTEAISVEPA
jgi:hypothetical protein